MTSRILSVLAALGVGLVACGGNVVFVEDGDGSGANGPGSGPGSGPGGPGSSCAALCAIAGPCLEGADCASTCAALYVAGCESEADALVACLTENLGPDCDPGFGCNGPLLAYGTCAGGQPPGPPGPPEPGGACVTQECEGGSGEGACSCAGICFGEVPIQQSCKWTESGVECECLVQGEFAGTCAQRELDCSLEFGCCREVFQEG